ncbi:SDR family NAD(P)-dependent oxidoreductase [Nocardia pseudobrasiliensis]|uniref:NAD(P)-dependent dehydrogenase (Short-subunit alcohol dehydrogenase family) n=1 Tax=Nocardia pseudobrasiliensis TaxID=45979 RepID=A0A370HYY2_9NOCA|nr:SDR family oxidoreductase [Nocardia pseudobrasiliensis]RDI63706.1 NAD(P)-dependent dehydrogenase (short-subunit alcohol dehydrogenase family) [Nocardia pseudobrasiliensis]
MAQSYVVTGGARGIGRAIVARLLTRGHVVVVERDTGGLSGPPWNGEGISLIQGDAGAEEVVEQAAEVAWRAAPLVGWVNNAAMFRDASIDSTPAPRVLELIEANLRPALTGSAVAVRAFLATGTGGSIVNISSHQARRAVPGALPYSTAKAAIEGLTRALAVEYGGHGIRVNAIAPGTVATERYSEYLAGLAPAAADSVEREMAALHPLGRVATSDEIAAAVAFLLSEEASFVNGVSLAVDGGRSVLALDPEAR